MDGAEKTTKADIELPKIHWAWLLLATFAVDFTLSLLGFAEQHGSRRSRLLIAGFLVLLGYWFAKSFRNNLQAWAKGFVVGILVVFVFTDSLRYTVVSRWLHDSNWSHGWLIPLFSVYFLWTKRRALDATSAQPSVWGAVVLVGSLAVYFYFLWRLPMGYPRALTLVGALFGLVLLLGGWPILRLTWFPIAFLLLAIPLPERIYVALTMPQQKLASAAAATIMPLVTPGLYTEAQGVVIDYLMPGRPAGQLNVEEACSGMRSLMAIVTLGVALAYLGDKPLWQRLVLLMTCVPIAILCNMMRVTLTGLFFIHGYEGLAKGTPHQILGLAMLVLALGMYSVVGWVLERLIIEGPDQGVVVLER